MLSSDKTIAIIDGSGVLSDPCGIDREELVRLAKLRVPVSHFDLSKLSKNGYLVRIEDQDIKLPCMSPRFLSEIGGIDCFTAGEVVADGTDFRNSAHLRFKADIFVPCGGRYVSLLNTHVTDPQFSQFFSPLVFHSPEAVNISNVGALVDHEGKPHFKYIVEGANLFLTQQARLFLEKRKVILYKDSSANKVGEPFKYE